MDFHIDRRLRLKRADEIQTKNLYSWSIVEVDEDGAGVGYDQIPWGWTTGFMAEDLSVVDRLTYEDMDPLGRPLAEGMRATHRSTIHAKLRPGNPQQHKSWSREPTYRFFGTDRVISDFNLDIVASDKMEEHGCTTWGSVSYTSEIDFRKDTTADVMQFYLTVPQATYDRYCWNVANGMADQVYLSVGLVAGFYSEWSPAISTDDVKVLAGDEHIVDGAERAELPRLGRVGKAELYMSAKRDLRYKVQQKDQEELGAPKFEQQERKGFWKR